MRNTQIQISWITVNVIIVKVQRLGDKIYDKKNAKKVEVVDTVD